MQAYYEQAAFFCKINISESSAMHLDVSGIVKFKEKAFTAAATSWWPKRHC